MAYESVKALEQCKSLLESGDARGAADTLRVEDNEVAGLIWELPAPPMDEGVLDLVKSPGVHWAAKKLGIATKTNVRKDLGDIYQHGQQSIAMSHRAADYTGQARAPIPGRKGKPATPGRNIDPETAIAQHGQAIKSHQATLSKLDRAHKQALSAGDSEAANWISHAKDVHNTHRDWNMRQSQALRFGHQASNAGVSAGAHAMQQATGHTTAPSPSANPLQNRAQMKAQYQGTKAGGPTPAAHATAMFAAHMAKLGQQGRSSGNAPAASAAASSSSSPTRGLGYGPSSAAPTTPNANANANANRLAPGYGGAAPGSPTRKPGAAKSKKNGFRLGRNFPEAIEIDEYVALLDKLET